MEIFGSNEESVFINHAVVPKTCSTCRKSPTAAELSLPRFVRRFYVKPGAPASCFACATEAESFVACSLRLLKAFTTQPSGGEQFLSTSNLRNAHSRRLKVLPVQRLQPDVHLPGHINRPFQPEPRLFPITKLAAIARELKGDAPLLGELVGYGQQGVTGFLGAIWFPQGVDQKEQTKS